MSVGPSIAHLAVALAMITSGAASARAQAQASPDYEAARLHYTAAEEAAARNDHHVAVREYTAAFEITRDPVLYFKIARSYEATGDYASAIAYYERFLTSAKPQGDNRSRAEELIRACQEKLRGTGTGTGTDTGVGAPTATGSGGAAAASASNPVDREPAPAPKAAPATPPSLEDEEPTWQRTAAWSSVGVTIAFLTAGAILGLSAASREEDVENLIDFRDAEGDPARFTGTTRERYDDLVDEGQRLESLALIAFGASAVTAAAAAVFFLIDPGPPSDDADQPPAAALRPTVSGHSFGLSWGWSF